LTLNRVQNDIIANPESVIFIASLETFQKHLGMALEDAIVAIEELKFIKKVPLFATLSKSKIELLNNCIILQTYENGDFIITQGEEDSKFFIIKSGKVDITVNNVYVRTLNETESFGERALFLKERRSASAQANGKVEVYTLAEKDFKEILEDNLKEFLLKRIKLQDDNLHLEDLIYLGILGNGHFGNVYLVQSNKNKALYAIKGVDKIQINAEILHKNLELERAILLKIDHPFIVKLVKTLKDKNFIYFLMEHIDGKELFQVIREIGLLNKSQTQFYGCSIMLAVDYLHERKCIYRDIKPENIIITEMVIIEILTLIGLCKAN